MLIAAFMPLILNETDNNKECKFCTLFNFMIDLIILITHEQPKYFFLQKQSMFKVSEH